MSNFTRYYYIIKLIALTMLVAACHSAEVVVPILATDPVTAPQASLVSILATSSTSAEVIVKGVRLDPPDWRLTVDTANTGSVSIKTGDTKTLPDFKLTTLQLTGLVTGQTYRLQLAFRFVDQDTILAVRAYSHRIRQSPRWTRLAHASFSGGDYTACPVAVDGLCGSNLFNGCGNPNIGAYIGNQVQLLRYPGSQQDEMALHLYDRTTDSWPFYPGGSGKISRHGVVQYNLFYLGVDRYQFSGLGFITEERAPGKVFYYHDMSALLPNQLSSAVNPLYGGEDGALAFFTTTDEAYFLTQNGTPAMRSIHAIFTQTLRAPLPELPGSLATFSIQNIGYVVNQRPGQPTHLWAYDPTTDSWARRADFPGLSRQQGIGFSLARAGYFGLGLTLDGQGLRDVWQYDPTTDHWQYVTDYPGQGNQLLAVFNAPDGTKPERAYLGWGYEAQGTRTGVIRTVGCTDWWELTP